MNIFTSDRKFTLVSYNASHGQLLFQSGKSDIHSSRLSVQFRDVRVMEVRSWTNGLIIEEVDASFLPERPSRPDQMMEHGHKVFLLRGKDWEGYVVGGAVLLSEDQKEFMEPVDVYW